MRAFSFFALFALACLASNVLAEESSSEEVTTAAPHSGHHHMRHHRFKHWMECSKEFGVEPHEAWEHIQQKDARMHCFFSCLFRKKNMLVEGEFNLTKIEHHLHRHLHLNETEQEEVTECLVRENEKTDDTCTKANALAECTIKYFVRAHEAHKHHHHHRHHREWNECSFELGVAPHEAFKLLMKKDPRVRCILSCVFIKKHYLVNGEFQVEAIRNALEHKHHHHSPTEEQKEAVMHCVAEAQTKPEDACGKSNFLAECSFHVFVHHPHHLSTPEPMVTVEPKAFTEPANAESTEYVAVKVPEHHHQKDNRIKNYQYWKQCCSDLGVDPHEAKDLFLQNDPRVKCLFACIFQKSGFLNGAEFEVERLREHVIKHLKISDANKERVTECFEEANEKHIDACSKANFFKLCVIKIKYHEDQHAVKTNSF